MSDSTTSPSSETPLGQPPRLGARGVARIEARLFPQSQSPQLGRYVLGERLGAGAHGRVHRAYDPQLQRNVAVKEMVIDPARSLARLEREAQTLAGLSHPNVVQIFESGRVADDRYFIAMEFVEGTQLGRWLRAQERPQERILEVFALLADGLSAIHRKGIVHRDFKPANVLLNNEGVPKIVDFGLAKRVGMVPHDPNRTTSSDSMSFSDTSDPKSEDRCSVDAAQPRTPTTSDPRARESHEGGFRSAVTDERRESELDDVADAAERTREFVGTPKYASPEQFLGVEAQPASDQFSFFVALFEALVGRHPFKGRNYAELGQLVVAGEVQWPARMARPLRRLLERGLAAKVDDRHASMAAVASALRDLNSPRSRARALPWVMSVGAAAAFATWAAASPPDCTKAADQQRAQWISQRDSLDAAHHDRNVEQLGKMTLTEFDRYVDRWADARTDACVAAEANVKDIDKTIACLDERFANFEVLAGVLEEELREANDLQLTSPMRTGVWLSPPEHCELDLGATPQDVDVELFSADLARIRVLVALGDWEGADAVATDTYARATELRALGPAAIARAQHGSLLLLRGESEAGRAELRATLLEAEALGHPLLVAEIQSTLATDLAVDGEEAAGVLVESALARVRATGLTNSNIEATLLSSAGAVHTHLGAFDLAARRNREAAAAFANLFGVDDARSLRARTNLAVTLSLDNQLEDAADEASKAWQALVEQLSEGHPLAVAHAVDVGIVLIRAGRYDAGLETLRYTMLHEHQAIPRLVEKRSTALIEAAYALTVVERASEAVPLLESSAPDTLDPAPTKRSLRWADVAVYTYGTLEAWKKAASAAQLELRLAQHPATYDQSLVAKAALRVTYFLTQDGRPCEALDVARTHRDMIERHQAEAAPRILEALEDDAPNCLEQPR